MSENLEGDEEDQEDREEHSGIMIGDHYDYNQAYMAEPITVPMESQFMSSHLNGVIKSI
jgi:hypothetical protein